MINRQKIFIIIITLINFKFVEGIIKKRLKKGENSKRKKIKKR
jgi:hypothetical protein